MNSTEKWGARVVYVDTDSMFVLLKGASKEQAFKIGKEIVDQVTAMNLKPVKLKFEKIMTAQYSPNIVILLLIVCSEHLRTYIRICGHVISPIGRIHR